MSEIDLNELRSELKEFAKPKKTEKSSPREQRIVAGFEEIERFVEEHERTPLHGEDRDIFERLYATRLDRIRASEECRELLAHRDSHGLLPPSLSKAQSDILHEDPSEYQATPAVSDEPDEEELLAALRADSATSTDIGELKHVRSHEEIRAAEEIAKRTPCLDFNSFSPVFDKVQQDLKSGERKTFKYKDYANVQKGDLFILEGQTVIVADMGEQFVSDHGRPDCRLRVVYDNGTESDLLLRSLQRALNKDPASRRITDPEFGPLFSGEQKDDDLLAGHIYVLRSLSEHAFVKQNRTVLHKIGVTGGEVKNRIANAKKDPTYLLADVEIVASYQLANINRKRLETLLHNFFETARLDLQLKDRFGFDVAPREWFLVPLNVINEAIEKLIDGTIADYRYDPQSATLMAEQ